MWKLMPAALVAVLQIPKVALDRQADPFTYEDAALEDVVHVALG